MEKQTHAAEARNNEHLMTPLSKQSLASLSKFLSRCTLSPNEIDEFVSLLTEINKFTNMNQAQNKA
jgi:hypothetical protein